MGNLRILQAFFFFYFYLAVIKQLLFFCFVDFVVNEHQPLRSCFFHLQLTTIKIIMSSSSKPKTTALEEITLGGVGAACAGLFTNPLEVIKVRIQLQGELLARGEYTVHYRNVLQAFYAVASTESMRSLQKGLVPALCYQFLMNGCRFGAYQAFDNAGFFRSGSSGGGGDVILSKAILASSISGGGECLLMIFGAVLFLFPPTPPSPIQRAPGSATPST